ncbi:MAG: AMP-binding protein [Sediminibacterium sp.]
MVTEDLLLLYKNNIAAITDEGEIISYHDLFKFSDQLFEHIGYRCLVFVLCANVPGSLMGYVACMSKKIVPLLLDAGMDKEALHHLIGIYQPEFAWLPAKLAKEFPLGKIVFERSGYSLVKLNDPTVDSLHHELALLFTTSGSTGSPKLVRVSYENLLSNAESIASYLSISAEERPVTVLPMNYSFGLSIINSHLLKGATLLLSDKSLMQKEFWTFIKNEKATSISGVPYTYEMLSKLRVTRMDLPSVHTLTQAGGKLNETLCKEFATWSKLTGKSFFVMYGQTEATARMSYLPAEFAIEKMGSIGKAIPGGRLSLVDEQRALINENEKTGELVYEGKNVSMGYSLNRDDLHKPDENKGILFTGDMAVRDADGFYYIVGRKKRFIKLYGNRIGLDETEQMLKEIISDCACTGEDDHMTIFITDPEKIEDVYVHVSGRTGINRKAFLVKVVDTIPKNNFGKIMYSKLTVA